MVTVTSSHSLNNLSAQPQGSCHADSQRTAQQATGQSSWKHAVGDVFHGQCCGEVVHQEGELKHGIPNLNSVAPDLKTPEKDKAD